MVSIIFENNISGRYWTFFHSPTEYIIISVDKTVYNFQHLVPSLFFSMEHKELEWKLIKSGFQFYTLICDPILCSKEFMSRFIESKSQNHLRLHKKWFKNEFPNWNRPIWHWKWNQYPDIWRAGNQLDLELSCFRADRNRIIYTVVLAIQYYEINPCDCKIMWPWIKVVWF